MNKKGFLKELCAELSGLSAADIKSSAEYYAEMIDERVEAGLSEEAAVAELGAPRDIARDIMMNMPLTKVIKTKIKKQRSFKAWEAVLLVLGSPIWISLLAAAICLVLAVYITLWSIYISLLATNVAAIFGGLGLGFASLFKLAASPANAVLCIGIGLCGIGAGAFCFLPCIKLGKCFVKVSIKIWKVIKALIIGKEKSK